MTLTRENDKTKMRILPAKELQGYIKEFEEEEAKKAEAAKKDKDKKPSQQ